MVGDYEKLKEPSTEVGNMVGHASLFSQMLSLVDRHRFERLAQSLHPVPIFWAGCRLKNPRMARFVPLFSVGIFQLMPIVRY